MYVPAAFADPDPERCRALIDAHPLATLVVNGAGNMAPQAEHVPLLCLPALVNERGDPAGEGPARYRLLGHVARANALARQVRHAATAAMPAR